MQFVAGLLLPVWPRIARRNTNQSGSGGQQPGTAIKTDRCSIEGLPVNRDLVFRVIHESGVIDQVKVAGTHVTWTRGRFEVNLAAGVNDLGEVLVSPSRFRAK